MPRPKQNDESVRVSLVVSRKQYEWVRHMAIQMSAREQRQIGISEAIRMAIAAAYPTPEKEQMELFAGK